MHPDRFARDGLLPLPEVLNSLWDSLSGLAPRHDWDGLRMEIENGGGGPWARDYRHKLAHPKINHGPFGELVRAVILDPKSAGTTDYLAVPEMVQNILREATARFGICDLERRFMQRAAAAVVKFRTSSCSPWVADAALRFGRAALRHEPIRGDLASCQYNGHGVAVSPSDVLGAERVDG